MEIGQNSQFSFQGSRDQTCPSSHEDRNVRLLWIMSLTYFSVWKCGRARSLVFKQGSVQKNLLTENVNHFLRFHTHIQTDRSFYSRSEEASEGMLLWSFSVVKGTMEVVPDGFTLPSILLWIIGFRGSRAETTTALWLQMESYSPLQIPLMCFHFQLDLKQSDTHIRKNRSLNVTSLTHSF